MAVELLELRISEVARQEGGVFGFHFLEQRSHRPAQQAAGPGRTAVFTLAEDILLLVGQAGEGGQEFQVLGLADGLAPDVQEAVSLAVPEAPQIL